MPGALDGIKIIDITSILLGPYATQMLGDMGADVIKVEAPPRGDPMRYLGASHSGEMGGIFLNANRNKRSIMLDLKQEAAKDALRELIRTADVLVHNMRAAAIERLGFGYDAVKEIRPDIVYCGAYGYSQKGEKRDLPAYDDLIQAASGFSSLFIETTGEARFAPSVIADKITGMALCQAVTTALLHRERTGEGQFVEVPMYETLASFLMAEHLYEHAFNPPLGSLGYKRLTTPARKPNKCKDGYIAVLPYSDKQWASFLTAAGHGELVHDPRFENHRTRNEHVHEIYEKLGEILAEKTVAEWVDICQEAQVPVSPVNSLDDVFNDPHMAEVGLFEKHAHPSEGEITLSKMGTFFDKSPTSIRRMPARLGENGEEVLREAGLSEDRIRELMDQGALLKGQQK